MSDVDLEYFGRRREQELTLAALAATPEAASAHRALATIYAEEVRRRMPASPRLKIVASDPSTDSRPVWRRA